MPAYVWRTLQDLRQELRARLGHQATGAASGASNPIIDSFLRTSQEYIYWMADWKKLTAYFDDTIGAAQNLLDYPTDANPDRLYTPPGSKSPIWVQYSSRWLSLSEGITVDHWDTMDNQNSYPTRYERYDQLLFWPKSNAVYTLKIWYIKKLERFTQENDRASVDDNLILTHALAKAKAHYRHPDANLYVSEWSTLEARVKGGTIGQNSVIRRTDPNTEPLPKPVVV
jgi:hypothetical protein